MSKCRRGNVLSASRAQVEASAFARSSSSASKSFARSRMRFGSTKMSSLDAGKTSVMSCSRSMSHGSQLSMPSKLKPSASLSQCSRPHGSLATKARARSVTAASSCSSRAGKMIACTKSSVLRWSFTLNDVSRSTSSPHRSIRIGVSAVLGNTSMIDPRRATSPRCSTISSRRYPSCTNLASNCSESISSPGLMMIGCSVVAPGPSFCNSARTEPSTTFGGFSLRKRHNTSSRRPMVSTLGLTRSNGSVSHAGNIKALSAPRNCTMSSCSCCAAVPVGAATTSVLPGDRALSAAMIAARDCSAHASTELRPPIAASAGSWLAVNARSCNNMLDAPTIGR